MPCRICLEDEGPFISPCYCNGTMKDVHDTCLIEWIRIKHHLQCELCHAPLNMEFNQEHERVAYLDEFTLQVLTNPALHIMIHSLAMIFLCNSHNFTRIIIHRFLQFQLTYNGICFTMMYSYVKKNVRNKQLYLYYLLSFPNVFLLLGTISLWIILIETPEFGIIDMDLPYDMENNVPNKSMKITKFIILSIINQASMGLYPLLHNRIVDQINKDRRPTFSMHIREHNH